MRACVLQHVLCCRRDAVCAPADDGARARLALRHALMQRFMSVR